MSQFVPLSGLRVVEYGHGISTAFCGKLLADMGAEIVKVEEAPLGDPVRNYPPFIAGVSHPERSAIFLYLNLGKKSVSIHPHTPAGDTTFAALVSTADLLISDGAGDTGWSAEGTLTEFRSENPTLITLSLTPFGQTGPYRDNAATDLTVWHAGGYGHAFPGNVPDMDTFPPLNGPGRAALYLAGTAAAVAAMHGLMLRRVTGLGSHIDHSEMESVASVMFADIAAGQRDQVRGPRQQAPGAVPSPPVAVLPCSNGYVAVSPREEHQWKRWVAVLGTPEWTSEERFKDNASRERHWDEVWALAAEWTRVRTKEEVHRLAQGSRVPCMSVNTVTDLINSDHLGARQYFQQIDHPVAGSLIYPTRPYRVSTRALPPPARAPLLGEHNEEVLTALSHSPYVNRNEDGDPR